MHERFPWTDRLIISQSYFLYFASCYPLGLALHAQHLTGVRRNLFGRMCLNVRIEIIGSFNSCGILVSARQAIIAAWLCWPWWCFSIIPYISFYFTSQTQVFVPTSTWTSQSKFIDSLEDFSTCSSWVVTAGLSWWGLSVGAQDFTGWQSSDYAILDFPQDGVYHKVDCVAMWLELGAMWELPLIFAGENCWTWGMPAQPKSPAMLKSTTSNRSWAYNMAR